MHRNAFCPKEWCFHAFPTLQADGRDATACQVLPGMPVLDALMSASGVVAITYRRAISRLTLKSLVGYS